VPNMRKHKIEGSLHTRRSHSMLHELQDYIKGVEAIAAARKDQLERIYEEKREQERKERVMRQACRSHENDYASFSNMVDVPTKVRALHEDVKNQKDKVRKYKEKLLGAERAVVAQQQQLFKQEEKMRVLQEALTAVGKTPKQVFDEQKVMEQMEEKDKTIADLEQRLRVVMKSRETDYKRFKMERGVDKRAAEVLQEELNDYKNEIEEKDKAIRLGSMKIKALHKQLDPYKRGLMKPAASRLPNAFHQEAQHHLDRDMGGGNTFITNPEDMDGDSNATVLHDDRHVHLMICVVRDDGKVKGKVIVTKADLEEKAAVTIQSHFRGHMVRKASQWVNSNENGRPSSSGQNAEPTPEEVAAEEAEQHAAAVKIQAIQRGNATRKELERIKSTKTNEEDADVAKDADAGKSPKKDSAPKKSGVSTPVGKARGGKPNANAPKAKPATTARKGR